jgi:8-hydroxy-5-deazaflavin:NADPH oxidoreductase
VLANSRGPETLASLVSTLGDEASAGTVDEAGAADVRRHRRAVAARPRGRPGLRWDGRIVIDATNDFDPSDRNGLTSSQVLAGLVASARVVEAANTLGASCGRREIEIG